MLVFIDESGDPGFRLAQGSSPVFVAAMVIFETNEAAQRTEAIIRDAMRAMRVQPEFKFNKCRPEVRDAFFDAVRNCPFRVRAIVVRKESILSPHLRSDKEGFYRYFVRQMMTRDDGRLEDATVIIDGSGDRKFRKTLKSQLRRQLGRRIREVRLHNSRRDPLVQLADMCCGAIARSYRTDRKDPDRWRRMLRPHIEDVWQFQ